MENLISLEKIRQKKVVEEQRQYQDKISKLTAGVLDFLHKENVTIGEVNDIIRIIQSTFNSHLFSLPLGSLVKKEEINKV